MSRPSIEAPLTRISIEASGLSLEELNCLRGRKGPKDLQAELKLGMAWAPVPKHLPEKSLGNHLGLARARSWLVSAGFSLS